ncbi:MAG TPA: hypothetical protein VGL93_07300 [Streptosporangiaceae bacterium]|jgi:hypothetical protein
MQWYWRLENDSGREVHQKGLAVETFGTQSDAESWLGENWRELRESGVSQVTLIDDGVAIYGPMSLAEE